MGPVRSECLHHRERCGSSGCHIPCLAASPEDRMAISGLMNSNTVGRVPQLGRLDVLPQQGRSATSRCQHLATALQVSRLGRTILSGLSKLKLPLLTQMERMATLDISSDVRNSARQ